MFKMLSGLPEIEVHHEYVCENIQKLACLHYMERVPREYVIKELTEWYAPGTRYSYEKLWIDASNKLSWVIPELLEIFPEARFLALVRDGRKVVSSFYYKLREEMYDDRSVSILMDWLTDPNRPTPPLEKRYWWNIPPYGKTDWERFRLFDRLQRVSWHWAECNRAISEGFKAVPPSQKRWVRLEDLIASEVELKSVTEFIGIDYDPSFFKFMQTPHNVFFPMDFRLTSDQMAQFLDICQETMDQFGYSGEKSYVVKY
jgi:hypothetical protein